jgi:Tfp pilus assembly protein PilO
MTLKLPPLKQRLILLISGMMGVGILIGAAVVFPTVRRIQGIGKEIYETEKFLEGEYLRARELKKSIVNIEDVARTARIFEHAIIRQEDGLRVITELEALAEAHRIEQSLDVQFTGADPKPGKRKELNLPYFTFPFVNHGAFADMVQHLSDIERLPYYVFIDTLSWERERASRRSGSAEGPLTLRFTARVYTAPTKE